MRKILPVTLYAGVVCVYGATGTLNNDVKIRESPSMEAKIVATRKKGRELEIVQKVDGGKDGYWYQTPKGYIYETFITLNEEPIVAKEEDLQKVVDTNSSTDEPNNLKLPQTISDTIVSVVEVVQTSSSNETSQPIMKEEIKIETVPTPLEKVVVVVEDTPKKSIEIAPVVEVPVILAPPPVVVLPQTPIKEEITAIVAVVEEAKPEPIVEKIVPQEEVTIVPLIEEKTEEKIEVTNKEEVKVEEIKKEEKEVEKASKYFIGVGLNFNTLEVKKTNQVGDIVLNKPLDEKATSFTLQAGTKLKENYELSVNYENVNLDDVKIASYFMSVNYLFNHPLQPYFGISLGMSDLEWQYDPLVKSQIKDEKLSSLLYGVQGGIIYPIEKEWSLFSQISYQKLDFKTNLTSTPAKATITHEEKKSIGVGLRYSF